jgi:hypothetical protein
VGEVSLICSNIKGCDFVSSNNDTAIASAGVADPVKQPATTDKQ